MLLGMIEHLEIWTNLALNLKSFILIYCHRGSECLCVFSWLQSIENKSQLNYLLFVHAGAMILINPIKYNKEILQSLEDWMGAIQLLNNAHNLLNKEVISCTLQWKINIGFYQWIARNVGRLIVNRSVIIHANTDKAPLENATSGISDQFHLRWKKSTYHLCGT